MADERALFGGVRGSCVRVVGLPSQNRCSSASVSNHITYMYLSDGQVSITDHALRVCVLISTGFGADTETAGGRLGGRGGEAE